MNLEQIYAKQRQLLELLLACLDFSGSDEGRYQLDCEISRLVRELRQFGLLTDHILAGVPTLAAYRAMVASGLIGSKVKTTVRSTMAPVIRSIISAEGEIVVSGFGGEYDER